MADLATLGIAVESSTVRQGVQALDELSGAAKKTEQAVEGVGRGMEQAGRKVGASTAYMDKILASFDKMQRTMDQIERHTAPLGAGFERTAQAMQKVEVATTTVTASMGKMVQQAKVANDNVRLTGDQVRNLGFQLNDAATMLAAGSSPFQVMATQAGQVVQALQDGPGGLRGSLAAIVSSIVGFGAALGPAVLGLAAFTAGVGALAYAYRGTFPDMDKTLEKHGALIDRVAEKYEDLADRIDAIGRAASSGLNVEAGALGRDLLKIAEEQAKALQKALVGADGFFGAGAIQGADPLSIGLLKDFGPISKQVEEYRKNLAAGRDTTIETRQALADLYREAGENGDTAMQKAIERFFALTDALAKVNASIRQNQAAIKEMGEVRSPMDQLKIDDPAEWERQNKLFEDQAKAIEEARKKAEDYKQTVADMKAGLSETVDALQLQVEHFGESEGALAAAAFAANALADAQRAAAAAGRESVDSTLLQHIKDQAEEYGELTDQLKKLNEEKRQAERLTKFEGDIAFERDQASRSTRDQQIASRLRTAGIELESDQGRRFAAYMQETAELSDARTAAEKRAQDALKETRDIIKDTASSLVDGFSQGESVLDSLIDTFAQLGQRLASMGMDRLFQNLFGAPGGASSASGTIGALGQMATALASPRATSSLSPGVNYTGFTAPIGHVERSVLPALTSNAQRFSVASDDLAGNIRLAAEELGVSARDIATVISYETGGTFDPWKKGPTTQWGTHRGLIQWGEPQAAKYGVSAMSTIAEQMQAAVRYWKDAGVKPGMGLLDVYSAVNAGRVGLYNRSDANNGGAWGTVADKVNYQMGGHRANADRLLGGDVGVLSRAVETGSLSATRKIASGSVPGVSVGGSSWGPQFNGVQNLSPDVMQTGGGRNLMGGALGAIGIGVSAYQSGDPLGGALSGGLGGMELGSMLGIGGPAGMLLGAGIGLLGGLFGGRSKKKEAERQAKMQADQAWSQNYNQLLDYKDVVYRVPKGELSGQITELGRTLDEFAKLADATKDSGNKRHIQEIREQLGRYTELLKDGFRDILDPVLSDLAAGRGLDTAFKKARDGVLAEAESYRGLIEDVKLAFQPDTSGRDSILADYKSQVADIEKAKRQAQMSARLDDPTIRDGKLIDPSADLPAKMKAFGEDLVAAEIERDKAVKAWEEANADVQRRYDEAVAKAVTAAREGLLRVVSGDIVEQSDIEKAIAEAKGAAAGLDVALKDLGLSAEEAAAAIEGALAKRMELLTETFTRGLQDQIDELDGKGYLAGFRDLIEQRDTLLKDASLINVDTSLVSTFFRKQAQSLVDGADLSATAFDELIALFPELSGVVRRFSEDLEALKERIAGYDDRRFAAMTDTSTLAGAIADFERRAARERQAEKLAGGNGMLALDAALAAEKVSMIQGLLIRARQDEVSEIENTISRLEGLRDEWKDLRASLKLDDTLSPLSQYDQFIEAQKQFRDISAKAAAGDEEAQAKLSGISQSYLEEAKAYYASSEDYYAAFREVQGVLDNAQTLADRELSIAQSHLDVAKAQLETMTGVKDSVATLAEALTVAMAALAGATKAATGGSTSGSSFVPKNELESFLGVQYGAILGRAPDASGIGYYQALRDQGATADQIIAMIKNSPEAKARGYAFGGLVSGPGTGTSDSIMARLSAGEFVMPARAVTPQTMPMLEGMRSGRMAGNDNAEMIAELRGLRAEVRSLRATVAEGELANVAATRAGVAAQQAAAVEQKKAASR